MDLPDDRAGHIERETFDAFLQLPAAQRKIIREVTLTFAKANGVAEVHAKSERALGFFTRVFSSSLVYP